MTFDQSTQTTDDTFDSEDGRTQSIAEEVAEVARTASEEMAARIIRAFGQWNATRELSKTERKKCNDTLAGRIAQFAEAMNVGHSSTNDQILKLTVVEQRWQELEDARDGKKTVLAACRDAIKACEAKIKDLLEEAKSGQLNLFQSSATGADGAGVQEDAG